MEALNSVIRRLTIESLKEKIDTYASSHIPVTVGFQAFQIICPYQKQIRQDG
jgi:hypothetical protein